MPGQAASGDHRAPVPGRLDRPRRRPDDAPCQGPQVGSHRADHQRKAQEQETRGVSIRLDRRVQPQRLEHQVHRRQPGADRTAHSHGRRGIAKPSDPLHASHSTIVDFDECPRTAPPDPPRRSGSPAPMPPRPRSSAQPFAASSWKDPRFDWPINSTSPISLRRKALSRDSTACQRSVREMGQAARASRRITCRYDWRFLREIILDGEPCPGRVELGALRGGNHGRRWGSALSPRRAGLRDRSL